MRLPYVIDNQTSRLADVIASLLAEHRGRSLDVATAYFTVGGFGLIREGLHDLGNLRLILGAEPTTGEQIGLRPDPGVVKRLIRRDLESLPFDEKTLRLVEDLIGYLRRDSVMVRLHDKGFPPCEVLAILLRPAGPADAFRPLPSDPRYRRFVQFHGSRPDLESRTQSNAQGACSTPRKLKMPTPPTRCRG